MAWAAPLDSMFYKVRDNGKVVSRAVYNVLGINLEGFSEAIAGAFPKTEVQSCIVHQIRNSLKYVASKNQKAFIKDLKQVYQAINKQAAEDALLDLEEKWGKQYPVVIASWQNNWEKLSEYFKYDQRIRKIIYTTAATAENAVEGYHWGCGNG